MIITNRRFLMREFTHNDFSIGLPDRWIDTSILAIAGPPDRGFSPSITITREKLDFQLKIEEYAANQLAALEQELGDNDYEVVEEGTISINNSPTFARIHTFDVSEDLKAKQMQTYFVKGFEALTITCTSTEDGFDDHKPLFMDAVKYFKWN